MLFFQLLILFIQCTHLRPQVYINEKEQKHYGAFVKYIERYNRTKECEKNKKEITECTGVDSDKMIKLIETDIPAGPWFMVEYDQESATFEYNAFIPDSMKLGIVRGTDYNKEGSDFIVFDPKRKFPQDWYGVEDGIQIKDTRYDTKNTPPLPLQMNWKNGKLMKYYKREDTNDHH